MKTAAVCYVATSGYLFETFLSAKQAREHTDASTRIFVLTVGAVPSAELEVFSAIAENEGITLVDTGQDLAKVQVQLARLYIDLFLPADVDRILYLDGDTQIWGDLRPLLSFDSAACMLAARDPMAFIRQVDPLLRRRIDSWMRLAGHDPSYAGNYVNTGVFRVERNDMEDIRESALAFKRTRSSRFFDQDFINLTVGGQVDFLSSRYNFPGFLLNSPLETAVAPRIVHYMSNPRPWEHPLHPWGEESFQPYVEFTGSYPDLAPYWKRLRGAPLQKYRAQQIWKFFREYHIRHSSKAKEIITEQHRACVVGIREHGLGQRG